MKTILRNEVTFTASLTDAPIPYSNIASALIGLYGLQAGATAPSLTEILQELSEIGIKDTDEVLDGLAIDGEDLLAITTMFCGVMPEVIQSGGDNEALCLSPLVLPLNLRGLAEGVVPSYHLNFTDNAKLDTEKLIFGIEHGVPIGKRYHYSKKNDTADTTGTDVDLSKKGKLLKALLLFATTIPTTTNSQRSIKELKILIGGKEHYHFNWFELGKGRYPKNAVDDTYMGISLDNYRILIFPKGLPADNLTVWTKSDTATDTIEFLPIYQDR